MTVHRIGLAIFLVGMFGCATSKSQLAESCPYSSSGVNASASSQKSPASKTSNSGSPERVVSATESVAKSPAVKTAPPEQIIPAAFDQYENQQSLSVPQESTLEEPMQAGSEPMLVPPEIDSGAINPVSLESVIASVYDAYPSLEAAIHQRGVVLGQQISAEGAFDTKFKAATENTPVGFYETFRNSVGFVQPLYQGGEVFAGYRVGRGSFEPWYKERQTNDGGEFKAGVVLPLVRDRTIDERRSELWQTQYERHIVEADIQAQLIDYVQKASVAYWNWVAAAESYLVADDVLKLANNRTGRIKSQVEKGLLARPELTDNQRLVAERQAKLSLAQEKLQKAAIKLSLYYRGSDGQPIVLSDEILPKFPTPVMVDAEQLTIDAQTALQQRPELAIFDLMQRQLDVEYSQACNLLQPEVDAVFAASKDIGRPTSKKNDKGPFQLDASIFVDVPLQRRKARGKIQSVQSKVSQVVAKRELARNQIVADVQSAYASLTNAFEQVKQTRLAVQYAEELAQRERRNLELGTSDLLKVTLREQYAAEARQKLIDELLDYYLAQAAYRAALAHDKLN